jgi:prepilin-type N-terminal cleavage/methylation domain-containing protein/prepilin-type processing-associated H-X9-DG protein
MRIPRPKRREAFTLIELLVVIAIIAILIGLLLPAVQKVREAAARMSCSNNLKQMGIALHSYHDANNGFPKGCAPDIDVNGNPGAWGSSWKVFILPYIEQGNISATWQYSGTSGYQNTNNVNKVSNITIKTYRCPSSILPAFYASSNNAGSIEMLTSYTGISGASNEASVSNGGAGIVAGGGILFPNSQVTFTSITDGTSSTLLVGEQSDHLRDANNQPIIGGFTAITSQGPHGWTMGSNGDKNQPPAYQNGGDNREFNCTTIRYMINQIGQSNNCGNGTCDNTGSNIPLSANHTGGANMLFADGSTKFMSSGTTLITLQQLATRAGGEVISGSY